MEFDYKENVYPENFILLGSPDRQKQYAEDMIAEASGRFPEWFEGKKPFFCFELRYVPPFDKDFGELKRLQGIAAEAAGRRDEFKGYIIINLSSYLTHEKEDYLRITLQFLVDMNSCWKYIFLVENSNYNAARELVRNILIILLRDIPCKVEEQERECTTETIVDGICSPSVRVLLEGMTKHEGYGPDVTVDFLRDTVIKYILTPKELEQFMSYIERRKEEKPDEKEEI